MNHRGDWELISVVVGHAERRSRCAERKLPGGFPPKDPLKRSWFNTVPNRGVSVTVSERHARGRSGKCCWSREGAEHFVGSWETLSTGGVGNGVKSIGMKCKSYRLGCLLLVILIRAAPWKEPGGECRCGEDRRLALILQAVCWEEGI